MNWLLGLVLGLVQGVSEWLPISSKTQVILVSTYFFNLDFAEAYALGLFMEIGTFFAALWYFRVEAWRVLKALVGRGDEESRLMLKFLVVVTLITAVLAVAIYKAVSQTVTGPVLGVPMIALGCVLLADGALITIAKGRRNPSKGLKELSLRDMALVGLAQGVAAFPGVSRSGATVSALLLLGVKPDESFRLSFIALIPASIGATAATVLLTHTQIRSALSTVTPEVVLFAILVTIVVGVSFIRVLLRVADSRRIALLTFALGALAILGGAAALLVSA